MHTLQPAWFHSAEASFIADFTAATAVSLLLPLPDLQAAAKKLLLMYNETLYLKRCPILMTLLLSKDLLPSLVSSACFPQICDHLLSSAKDARRVNDITFPAALAQLVLSQNMVSSHGRRLPDVSQLKDTLPDALPNALFMHRRPLHEIKLCKLDTAIILITAYYGA